MRIDAGMASFYNASSSRLQSANSVNAASASARVSGSQGTADAAAQSNSSSQYLSSHGGVIQTRVSPQNSYQKAMLDNPRSIAEGMASKLMGKLPNILRDMQNLTDNNSVSAAASDSGNSSGKVVITEASAGSAMNNGTGANGAGAGSAGSGASGSAAASAASGAMMDFAL